MDWTTACPDWERRILAQQSLVPCPPLFPGQVSAARDVLREFRLVDLSGAPSIVGAARPWTLEFIDAVFGAYDQETGRRLIQEFFLLISKKNAKSTIAAAIMVTALVRCWRDDSEFFVLAPTKEAANNAFLPAKSAVKRSPVFSDMFHIQEHMRQITHRKTGASLKVIAADSQTVVGKKTAGLLVDELHEFGSIADAEEMLREATGGLAARPEGFVIYLSTQSSDPPAGVFKSKLSYARKVRDGEIADRSFMPVLYEHPKWMLKGKQYLDQKYFFVTNPNFGASVDIPFLEREFKKAKDGGEASLRGFLAKHLNVETGLGLRSDRWVGADSWEGAGDETLTLDAILKRSEVVVIGIDGGGADDLLGVSVLGRERFTDRWLHWAHAFAHPLALARRKSEESRYRDFESDGDLTVIGDYPEDIEGVIDIVRRVQDAGLLGGVGIDQIGIGGLVDALDAIGVNENSKLLCGVSQGYRLTGAIKGLERKLIDGSFAHGARPMMAWCLGNAKVEPTKNAFLITKQASGTAKIDPLMALFDAAVLMERNPSAVDNSPQIFVL